VTPLAGGDIDFVAMLVSDAPHPQIMPGQISCIIGVQGGAIMKTVTIQTFIGNDGIVQLRVPKDFRNLSAEVQVSVPDQNYDSKEDWLTFLERFYGIQAADPVERPDQLEIETREEIE
jgi:hypothetical protein